jgi:hypothetical protein
MGLDDLSARRLGLLATAVVFASLFACLLVPISDPDFWWHLASGKLMVLKGAFLDRDPFTMDFRLADIPANTGFILKYSWLSQVTFYLVHAAFGIEGVVVLFGLAHTLMFFVLYRALRHFSIGRTASLTVVMLAFAIVVLEFRYNVPRPQAWSGVFAVLIVLLLELLKEQRSWTRYAIPALMALWANLHGGFVLGDLIILIYAAGAFVSRTGNRTFYAVSALAILASGLNPNGFRAALSFPLLGPFATTLGLASQEELKAVLDAIVENQSLFGHASLAGILRKLPVLGAFLVVSVGSFAINVRNRGSIRPEHLLLFLALLLMGVGSIRYIVFLVTIGSLIAAINLKLFLDRSGLRPTRGRIRAALVLANALFAFLLLPAGTAHARQTFVATGTPSIDRYGNALRFMRESGLAGNVFNDYNAGGAIIWNLSPGTKVFVDGRALYPMALRISRDVMNTPLIRPEGWDVPAYKLAFTRFDIDMVLIPGCDPVSGSLTRLAPVLVDDPDWALVYADDDALLFVRNGPKHAGIVTCFGMPKQRAFHNIMTMAWNAGANGHARTMSSWLLSMAVANAGLGNPDEAALWIDKYLSMAPGDPYALSVKRGLASRPALRPGTP